MQHHPRIRTFAISAALVVVAVIVTAFAVGGRSPQRSIAQLGTTSGTVPQHSNQLNGIQLPSEQQKAAAVAPLPNVAATAASSTPASSTAGSTAGAAGTPGAATAQSPSSADSSGVTATRVVKTGSMSLAVKKGQVQSAVSELVRISTHFGGYVSQTRTEDIDNSPTGEVTLRMPVNQFEQTVTAVEQVGQETALTTIAHDVTGKFVDLGARLSALQRTRQTYLSILNRATTIGQTLSIQQRIEDVQQQIEQLQGELKVLRNQSADGTLTVDVAEAGATTPVAHHHRSGISKAWHTSVSRFSRGIDAIVGALGPLLLALILLGLAVLIIRLGLRHTRRATT